MYKLKKISMLYMLLIVLFTASCQHDTEVAPALNHHSAVTAAELPIVKNGRLAFSHPEQFKYYMKNLSEKTKGELNAFNTQLGFTSLSMHNYASQARQIELMKAKIAANPSLLEEGADLSRIVPDGRDELIPDDYFAAVLNKDREFEIAKNVIFRITRDFCFMYTDGKAALIDAFLADVKNGKVQVQDEMRISEDLTAYRNESKIETTVVEVDRKGKAHPVLMQDVTQTDYFRYDRRFVGKIWQNNWIVYASSGAESYYQHRSLGIWWAATADRLIVRGTMVGKQVVVITKDPIPPSTAPWQLVTTLEKTHPITEDETETNRVTDTLEWTSAMFTISPPFISAKAETIWVDSANTYHFGSDRGNSGAFYLNW